MLCLLACSALPERIPPSLPSTAAVHPPRSLADMVCAPLLFLGNLWAGQLSEATANAGMGPVGCFGMGFVACAASGLLLVAATLFGDLGKPEHVNLGKLKRKSKAA